MSRVLRVLAIYILLDFFNNAVGVSEIEDITSVEIDGLENNEREDDNHERVKLMGIDYYNAAEGTRDNNDYETSSRENLQLKMDDEDISENIVILDSMDLRNYKLEIQAGNKADILGTNSHYYQPSLYPDFSRRFVLQYPYTEIKKKMRDEAITDKLTPKLASPELVLAVAQKSALLDTETPKDHNIDIVRKEILRTGDYWNAVWKEEVDPNVLRTKQAKKLESIRAEIPPGSKLYDLVNKLKHLSPTLLYVINDKET